MMMIRFLFLCVHLFLCVKLHIIAGDDVQVLSLFHFDLNPLKEMWVFDMFSCVLIDACLSLSTLRPFELLTHSPMVIDVRRAHCDRGRLVCW